MVASHLHELSSSISIISTRHTFSRFAQHTSFERVSNTGQYAGSPIKVDEYEKSETANAVDEKLNQDEGLNEFYMISCALSTILNFIMLSLEKCLMLLDKYKPEPLLYRFAVFGNHPLTLVANHLIHGLVTAMFL